MKAREPSEPGRRLRDPARDSYPTDPCVVVRGKGLRELLLECEAKAADVVVIVDSGDSSGEIVLSDGAPQHAAYEGKIGLAAFVALLDVDVTLLRLSVPRTLSRYPRTISLSLADLGVSRADEGRKFASVFPPAGVASVPPAEPSSVTLDGLEPRDGMVRIALRLVDAAWKAWSVVAPRAEGTIHSGYVFGSPDETLHLGGERLGRALLRRVVVAVESGRAGTIVTGNVDGMAVAGGTSSGFGCVVATREGDAKVAREVAGLLMAELRRTLEAH